MSEEPEGVAEEAVEETPAEDTTVATEEPAAEAPAAEEPAAEAEDAPVAEAEAEAPVAEEPVAEEPVAEEEPAVEVDEETPIPAAMRREALVYLCERGHRTLVLFGEAPPTCNARITRNSLCGRPIYHMTELPEQVQKALNPLKASKKKVGKK